MLLDLGSWMLNIFNIKFLVFFEKNPVDKVLLEAKAKIAFK
jgi:hypothetical protein